MKYLLSLILIATSVTTLPARANWQLVSELSNVNFVSIKQEHIAEAHYFKALSGYINNQNELRVTIDLSSVETNISIRNERMQTMLFDVANNRYATLTADVGDALRDLNKSANAAVLINQAATLELNGKTNDISFQLLLSKTARDGMVASIAQPALINAASYGLNDGVAALQKIAGLNSITKTVPVNGSLVFRRK